MSRPSERTNGRVTDGRHLLAASGGTLLLLGALLYVSRTELASVFQALSPELLLALVGLQALVTAMASSRVHLLLRPRSGYVTSLTISLLHAAFLAFAPLHSGELSYVYLVRRLVGRAAVRGLSQLVVLRLYDVLVLVATTLVLLPGAGAAVLPHHRALITGVAGATVTALAAFMVALLWRGAPLLECMADLAENTGRPGMFVGRMLRQSAAEIHMERWRAALLLLLSTGIWLGVLLAMGLLLTRGGVQLPLATVAFVLCLQRFLLIIPIPALGRFGPLELSWTALVIPLGVPAASAAAAMVVAHGVMVVFACGLGVLGGALLLLRWRRAAPPAP